MRQEIFRTQCRDKRFAVLLRSQIAELRSVCTNGISEYLQLRSGKDPLSNLSPLQKNVVGMSV